MTTEERHDLPIGEIPKSFVEEYRAKFPDATKKEIFALHVGWGQGTRDATANCHCQGYLTARQAIAVYEAEQLAESRKIREKDCELHFPGHKNCECISTVRNE